MRRAAGPSPRRSGSLPARASFPSRGGKTPNPGQLACDTQTLEHDTCLGFDGWTNADLARFHAELLREPVEVVDDAED
ncbi:MAG TPA: hypothetical protein VFY71_14375 [Planctomycetota bacterium]|nr:hypothetical protein [Planctomycetota bacterium]